jgi:sortase A
VRTETQDQGAEARPHRSVRRAAPLTVVGVVLMAVGLACLGWVGYQLVGTDLVAQRSYDRETQGLRTQWSSEPAVAPGTTDGDGPVARKVPGSALALLRIPRFGGDFEVPVVAGTALADLAHGVGHYDETAGPGEVGNFAVAGHRITHGQPFAQLLTLRKGDEVVVETREAVFTYVMDTSPRDLTVKDDASWVLDPVPDRSSTTPTRALITLTTCQDLFHSPDRSVGFGHLESTQNK